MIECGQFKERRMSHSGADMYVNKRKNVPGVLILPNGTTSHCMDLDRNDKRPGVTSDGNFSSYLIGRS